MSWLDPTDAATSMAMADFPFLVEEVADQLFDIGRLSDAAGYYEVLRHLPGELDPHIMVQLGRCYLDRLDYAAAEEQLLAAIDADPDSIDARIELAKVYELA